jgi:hypothetical protein
MAGFAQQINDHYNAVAQLEKVEKELRERIARTDHLKLEDVEELKEVITAREGLKKSRTGALTPPPDGK